MDKKKVFYGHLGVSDSWEVEVEENCPQICPRILPPKFSHEFVGLVGPCFSKASAPPPEKIREIDTIWQIGILTGKPCTFRGQKRVIFGILAL